MFEHRNSSAAVAGTIGFRTRLLLLTSVLSFTGIQAQTTPVLDDIYHINRFYSELPSLSVSVTYTLYSSYTSHDIVQVEKGSYIRDGQQMYTVYGSMRTMLNSRYYLLADENTETMLVKALGKDEVIVSAFPTGIDTLITGFSSIEKITELPAQRGYRFILNPYSRSQIEKLDVYFSKKTYAIARVVLYYTLKMEQILQGGGQERPRLEITYDNLQAPAHIPDDLFDESGWFTLKNGEARGTGMYRNYSIKLINTSNP